MTDLAWPGVSRQHRPWAYWWWMGSAVDKTNLTRELQRYHDAGYGGLHIIPIYGAKGWEDKYISYLSPQWMEMLAHTVSEAQRLDLGIDMTTGTGWCFGGGTNVSEREGNASVVVNTFPISAGRTLTEKFYRTNIQALVAYSPDGAPLDITRKIEADGTVNWTAPPLGPDWRVYAISQKLAAQKVKRAAPGGEGPMLNLLYDDAMPRFLREFSEAFAAYTGPKPRAQYHDSYEYKSEWSPDFFSQFERHRGYRLQSELPALFAGTSRVTNHEPRTIDPDRTARVRCDYRETVSDIIVEDSLPIWVKWSRKHGFLTRNEAHGSPGNLLDLYALADIPETEMFYKDRNKLISKFASSAAHVTGRNLVACETGTWLNEHFTETLADMKYLLDDLFLSGVNHVFYHGTCYSPDEAAWPGWVFYASYQMNPRNSVWRDSPAVHIYVARCQSILQGGRPDNDILLYWPIHDFWQQPGTNLLPHLTVHARDWFEAQPFGHTASNLWARGYAFDYISDRQLDAVKVNMAGEIESRGGNYRVVVVPPCQNMPVETLKKLLALAKAGATVIFEDELPKDVPGLANLDKRRSQFNKLAAQVLQISRRADAPNAAVVREKWIFRSTAADKGRVRIGELETALAASGVARETMSDHPGLMCIRRSFDGGRHYFIANRGEQRFDGWLTLASPAKSVVIMDPLSGSAGVGALRQSADGAAQVYLQLAPGASVILRAFTDRKVAGPAWNYWRAEDFFTDIKGKWRIEFISGGPMLPIPIQTEKLVSWTELGGEEAQRFAGTARYSITFDAPDTDAKKRFLDLGKVCQSARVRLNGNDLGTLITPPFRVVVDDLKPQGNLLEIEVTNVSANRIRDLDRRGVKWRNFNDINFVNINYRPFDASDWPDYDSGLIGPVTLTGLAPIQPTGENTP